MNCIGDIKTKDDLLSHLLSFRAAGVYDIFAQTCLHEFIKDWKEGNENPDELVTELPEGTVTFREFMDSLSKLGDQAPVETKRNANRFLTRNLLREGFRVTQSYCEETNQSDKMTSKPWYQFARIVVNCLSHNFKYQFRQYDLSKLPVAYLGNTIDQSQDGKSTHLKLGVLLSLFDEITDLVRNDIA